MSFDTEVVKKAFTMPIYWKMAVVKCAIYAGVAGCNAFEAGVKGYDRWSDMTQMTRVGIVINVLIAMGSAWMAFLDQTITRMGGGQITPEHLKQMLADMTKPS